MKWGTRLPANEICRMNEMQMDRNSSMFTELTTRAPFRGMAVAVYKERRRSALHRK
jgi:hypothetical protein